MTVPRHPPVKVSTTLGLQVFCILKFQVIKVITFHHPSLGPLYSRWPFAQEYGSDAVTPRIIHYPSI